MEYRVKQSEFGGQPLAGYLMNVKDLTNNKDGCDSIAFLRKIDDYCRAIEEMSDTDENKMYEFFFAIATEEDVFAFDFYVGYTVAELKNKDYVDGWEWNDVHYYRMYTQDEEWGLDEIELCNDVVKVAEINIPKEPSDIFNDDMNGELKYKCPNCGCEFIVARRCPHCGQAIKEKENEEMENKYEVMEVIIAECYSDFYDKWFTITKDMGRSENRITFLNSLLESESRDENISYVGFKYEDINDVCESSDYVISYLAEDVREMKLVYMNEFNSETGIHKINRIQFENDEYNLVRVTVSRLRVVEERAETYVAVPKKMDIREARDWAENELDEDSYLDWEEHDNEFEIRDFAVVDYEIEDTDTLDELESSYDIEHTIE